MHYRQGNQLDHLAINSTTAVSGEADIVYAVSAYTAEFLTKWSNIYQHAHAVLV